MKEPLLRILLVEDDPDIRAVAQLSLEMVGGFRVGLCASGEEALERAPGFEPQLILLDVMMPGLDGPATLAALRRDVRVAAVPVIFMTAKVQPQEVSSYLELGAIDVLAKPFEPMGLPGQLQDIWSRLHE